MTANDLIDLLKALPVTTGQTLIAVEMPDDKAQYAVNGARFDSQSNSVIIEVS